MGSKYAPGLPSSLRVNRPIGAKSVNVSMHIKFAVLKRATATVSCLIKLKQHKRNWVIHLVCMQNFPKN